MQVKVAISNGQVGGGTVKDSLSAAMYNYVFACVCVHACMRTCVYVCVCMDNVCVCVCVCAMCKVRVKRRG